MKYRTLTTQELEPLAEDFAIFLASNSIDKADWDTIKEENPEKAEEVLNVFSDMVFEKALSSARYIERISDQEITVFNFYPTQAHLVHMRIIGNATASFKAADFNNTLTNLIKNKQLEIRQGTKKYTKERTQEMFDVIQKGATLSNGELYQKLITLIT